MIDFHGDLLNYYEGCVIVKVHTFIVLEPHALPAFSFGKANRDSTNIDFHVGAVIVFVQGSYRKDGPFRNFVNTLFWQTRQGVPRTAKIVHV
jgi:hypothetical protein